MIYELVIQPNIMKFTTSVNKKKLDIIDHSNACKIIREPATKYSFPGLQFKLVKSENRKKKKFVRKLHLINFKRLLFILDQQYKITVVSSKCMTKPQFSESQKFLYLPVKLLQKRDLCVPSLRKKQKKVL